MDQSAVVHLSQRIGQPWPHIEASRILSQKTLRVLQEALPDTDSEDISILVLGSLGRDEFTPGSDIDWNLLLDGIASPSHHALATTVRRAMDKIAAKDFGREGTFGDLVISHDLIHRIGGEDDTNRNTTRRLLLLLESTSVRGETARVRVTKNILKRYLFEDRSFWRATRSGHHIPHFLLNDFARLWRTMAMDFAHKLRARSWKGWAIRNLKLRMSRKLLYVAGLLGCFRFHLDMSDEERLRMFANPEYQVEALYRVYSIFAPTPLEIVAEFLDSHPNLDSAAKELFTAYDGFLGLLVQEDTRQHLEKLTEESADSDEIYQMGRGFSHRFRDALLNIFFDDVSGMNELTRLYGVF